MALEIPPLGGDPLPNANWGSAPAMERLSLAAGALLGALEEVPVSTGLLDALRALAASGAAVDLFLGADRGWVQIVLGGRRVTLTGSARDAALTLLGAPPDPARLAGTTAPKVLATAYPDSSTNARAASIQAQVQESRSKAGRDMGSAQSEPSAQPSIAVRSPLLSGLGVEEAAQMLRRAVSSSGLFLEAHVAQWLRGERSFELVQEESDQMAELAGAFGSLAEADAAPDRRASAQLDALQHQTIQLTGEAWAGQPIQLEIECDRERNREAANLGDATGLFLATLHLNLPHLGAVRACIRVIDTTVGVHIEAGFASALAPELPQLTAALSTRGLQVAALDLAPIDSSGAPAGVS